jgi:hypothetical protein
MKPPKGISRRQLALSLECEIKNLSVDQAREEIVQTLAELLLEALGEDVNESISARGEANESEDNQ